MLLVHEAARDCALMSEDRRELVRIPLLLCQHPAVYGFNAAVCGGMSGEMLTFFIFIFCGALCQVVVFAAQLFKNLDKLCARCGRYVTLEQLAIVLGP